ncbi:B''BETA [Symbiodinium sp. KB8]|nr:B''BETA [Symbiodinium sp. KB8]
MHKALEMLCVVWAAACLRTAAAEADIGCVEEEAALSLRQLRVKGQSRDGGQDSVDSQSSELGLGLDSSTVDSAVDVVDLSSDADSSEQAGMPMIPYPKEYCRHCGEMAFCHRASNPGCGGYATSGVASFNNRIRAQGCSIGPVLTVPRSYVRDISVLAKTPGGFATLVQMLQSGFQLYEGKGLRRLDLLIGQMSALAEKATRSLPATSNRPPQGTVLLSVLCQDLHRPRWSRAAFYMHIGFASGKCAVDLSITEFEQLHADGGTVQTLKKYLHGVTGHRRFVQKLLCGNCLLSNESALQWGDCLQLVILSFRPPTDEELEELATAVECDDVEAVDAFLHCPLDPDLPLRSSSSLSLACGCGSLKVAQLLLEAGADKDRLCANALAPLHVAAAGGQIEAVRLLVSSGANVNLASGEGTALLLACTFGHVEVVEILLAAGASTDQTSKQRRSPLHMASFAGHADIVASLIDAGDCSNKIDQQGNTPLHLACLGGRLEVVRLLAAKTSDINRAANDGETPLSLACVQDHASIVSCLVKAGASTNNTGHLNGLLPLHFSCLTGRTDVVINLVEAGDGINKVDNMGRTPLHLACIGCHLDVVRWLLRNRADQHTLDALGCTALERAIERSHHEVVRCLTHEGSSFPPMAVLLVRRLVQMLHAFWRIMSACLRGGICFVIYFAMLVRKKLPEVVFAFAWAIHGICETDVLSPPPEPPISPGSGPTGVKNSMIATNAKTIPRFWWPKRDQISELGQEYKDQIHDIFVKQGITDGLKNWEQCEQIVTDVFKLSKYFAAPIFHKMKAFYDIVDRSAISKRDAMMVPTPVPITEMMVVGWANRKIQPDDPTLSFFSVVKKDHNDWIEKEDFDVFLHAILMTHPGLDFLLDTQEFQDRYADTVTSRIFYIYDRKGTGRIYLQNLRRYQPSIVETWKQLEDYDDMKMIRDYFSYEHFYVIYCTFWELDSDHDFLLDKDDLLKYDGHALSRRTVDRIFSEVTCRFTSAVPGKMGYEDFIHFLLNDQDQITDRSIEFWFNIFDLDADGVVRDYELTVYSLCLQAVIKNADMAEDMQQDAIDCATQALEKYNIEKDIAAFIKKEFDKKYNPTWHAVVGRNFGSYVPHPQPEKVTHETKHFIYFYLGLGLNFDAQPTESFPKYLGDFYPAQVEYSETALSDQVVARWVNDCCLLVLRLVKFFYEEQVQRMECLNYETIAFCDVLCQLHDMICPRVAGEFRLADFKRKRKFAGSFFSIFTNTAEAVRSALRDFEDDLHTGLRLESPGAELVVGACEPPAGGRFGAKTEIILADQVLGVFQKIHVLPYKDTFKYNFDHMYHNHLVPYFQTQQVGEFTKGFEFSYDSVRFQVVGVQPEDSYGVVGHNTEIFYEGPEIERKVLERLQLIPFEEGLPDKYRPNKLSLDEAGLLRDYVRPYFAQRSAAVRTGETLQIRDLRFKIIATRPSEGGGVGKETELACQGVALKEHFKPPPRAQPKGKAAAKAAAALMWRVLGSWTRAAGQFEKSEVSLNKFMAFENRDPFQAKQEQMENPNSTSWHRWCADQYLRLAMEEGEDMDEGQADG